MPRNRRRVEHASERLHEPQRAMDAVVGDDDETDFGHDDSVTHEIGIIHKLRNSLQADKKKLQRKLLIRPKVDA